MEYEKLPRYDAPTALQPAGVFLCHSAPEALCSGWLACHGPDQLLGVRIGVIKGEVDPVTFEYTTDVLVFASGAEAAAHGIAAINCPSVAARKAMAKVARVRRKSSSPLFWE